MDDLVVKLKEVLQGFGIEIQSLCTAETKDAVVAFFKDGKGGVCLQDAREEPRIFLIVPDVVSNLASILETNFVRVDNEKTEEKEK